MLSVILTTIICFSSMVCAQQQDNCKSQLNSIASSASTAVAKEQNFSEAPLKNQGDEAKMSLSTLVDLILKILNIGVIIYIFSSGRAERREDVYRKKYYFWFQDLLIKGGKVHIDTFFNEIDKLIESHSTAVEGCAAKKSTTINSYKKIVTETHRAFNKQKRNLDKNFVSLLYVVTPELGIELDQMLNDLQDSFGEKIQTECHSYSSVVLENLATNFKKDFLSKLFNWKADL